MTYAYRESLICYLSQVPNGKEEIDRMVDVGTLTREEAVLMSLRIMAEKLDQRLDELVEKWERKEVYRNERLRHCTAS
jgi:hypothetical protein